MIGSAAPRDLTLHVLAHAELEQEADDDEHGQEEGVDAKTPGTISPSNQHEEQKRNYDIDRGFPDGENVALGPVDTLSDFASCYVFPVPVHAEKLRLPRT